MGRLTVRADRVVKVVPEAEVVRVGKQRHRISSRLHKELKTSSRKNIFKLS